TVVENKAVTHVARQRGDVVVVRQVDPASLGGNHFQSGGGDVAVGRGDGGAARAGNVAAGRAGQLDVARGMNAARGFQDNAVAGLGCVPRIGTAGPGDGNVAGGRFDYGITGQNDAIAVVASDRATGVVAGGAALADDVDRTAAGLDGAVAGNPDAELVGLVLIFLVGRTLGVFPRSTLAVERDASAGRRDRGVVQRNALVIPCLGAAGLEVDVTGATGNAAGHIDAVVRLQCKGRVPDVRGSDTDRCIAGEAELLE